jgi:hypothetical protein
LQEFGIHFTTEYLKMFLEEPIEVVVNCNRSEQQMYVRMKMGKKKEEEKGAIMTTGWKEVVKEFSLRRGEIFAFSFRDQHGTRFEDPRGRLRLVMVPLDN